MHTNQPRGYMGQVLWVDLTRGECRVEAIPDAIYERFLSGLGLGAYLLYRSIPAGADPLGPDNVLGFVTGLLAGTGTLLTGRWMALAKSPLTGAWGESNCGGNFAPAIKGCGYDGIFFTGASPRPVYLYVADGRPELRDAREFWGLDAIDAEDALLARAGKGAAAAVIGQSGEKRSLLAGISNDRGRLAARGGLGAVMGSKNLKAVVLKGVSRPYARDPRQISRLNLRLTRWLRLDPPLPPGKVSRYLGALMRLLPQQMAQDGLLYAWMLRKWGTISMNQISIEMGDAPIQNWRGSNEDFGFRHSDSVNPDRIVAREKVKYHCYSCPLSCGGVCEMDGSRETHKPEYETLLSWGGLLLNSNLDNLFEINELLNRAGLDSISAGATVAFAIECFERGILTLEDTGGLALHWGDSAAILALLQMMIDREGIGALLADGSRLAAARLGRGAEELAVHAGGQELAMHDGRNDPGFALHAAAEPSPGRHTSGSQLFYEMYRLWTRVPGLPRPPKFYPKREKYQNPDEKARIAAACSRFTQVMNTAGLCLFGALIGVDRLPVFEWLNAATGWKRTPEEYMLIGERIQTLRQAFNAREGIPLRHTINRRALGLPKQKSGANRGRSVDLDVLIPRYWAQFGWDPTSGAPTPECLRRLELEDVIAATPIPAGREVTSDRIYA